MASASDAAFYEVLEADLRALSSEARKSDSLATQITGWLQHTDFPQIKECAERALLKLRAIAQEGKGIEAVRSKVDFDRTGCVDTLSLLQHTHTHTLACRTALKMRRHKKA